MRICLVYDCFFPNTIGGAERWYREIAERLVEEGHEVTYLTLTQWDRGCKPSMPGVSIKPVGPRMALYVKGEKGRRRILPPLVFGLGVLLHLLARGRRYDVVHTASFPYFSLIAAALVRPLHRFRLVVDWHEVWSREYWRDYLGGAAGFVGWLVQHVCVRFRHDAFAPSRLYAERLRSEGFKGRVEVLDGRYAGSTARPDPEPAQPVVVAAGRHIPEKQVPAIVPALAEARRRAPDLRGEIFGDGPDRPAVLALIERMGLGDAVEAPGFVPAERVERAMRESMCMVLASRREGYGMVVVEAASRGTPSVVVRGPDNAATELIDEGENGFVAESASPEDLAEAILKVYDAGDELRGATADWFERNAARLSLSRSLDAVARSYAGDGAPARR